MSVRKVVHSLLRLVVRIVQLLRWAAVCLLAACAGSGSDSEQQSDAGRGPSPAVREYLNELLVLAERHSIRRANLDWPVVRANVLAAAGAAASREEAYPAIQRLLEELADGHSLYQSPTRHRLSAFGACGHFPERRDSIPANIGYVRVPSYHSGPERPEEYASRLHDQTQSDGSPQLAGWIVDLRDNRGGDMWPMILGVGRLLGLGPAGYFTYPDGSRAEWGYGDGSVILDGVRVLELQNPREPESVIGASRVAVLTSRATVSAGEAVAVAFRGRPSTRFFGEPTCGRSTVNRGFRLSDGAWLFLTTATLTDRNNTSYGGPIEPDEQVPQDEAVKRAIEWIMSQ